MRIAIVKLSALGDIIHAMVVLQFIKQFNRNISIDWVVEESFKELLNFHPHINQVYSVNLRNAKKKKSFFVLIKELRRFRKLDHYDLVIDMQGLIKSAIISWLIPSTNTIGFDKFSIREKLASTFYDKRFNMRYEENVIKRNFELIKFALDLPFLSKDIQNKLPFLFSRNEYTASNLSDIKKNVLVIPGASHPSKRYPVESFAKLIHILDANYLVLWGSRDEELLAKEIKSYEPHVHICPKLSIGKLTSLISKLDLVIGPDTGPTHIAWALNAPSITLFGPTPGYRNTFETSANRIIESDSRINPNKIDKDDFSIRNIEVEKIVSISKELLRSNN